MFKVFLLFNPFLMLFIDLTKRDILPFFFKFHPLLLLIEKLLVLFLIFVSEMLIISLELLNLSLPFLFLILGYSLKQFVSVRFIFFYFGLNFSFFLNDLLISEFHFGFLNIDKILSLIPSVEFSVHSLQLHRCWKFESMGEWVKENIFLM